MTTQTIDDKMSEKHGHTKHGNGHDSHGGHAHDEHGHTSTHGGHGDHHSINVNWHDRTHDYGKFVSDNTKGLFSKLMKYDGTTTDDDHAVDEIASLIRDYTQNDVLKKHLKVDGEISDELKSIAENYVPSVKEIKEHLKRYNEISGDVINSYLTQLHAPTLQQTHLQTLVSQMSNAYSEEDGLEKAKELYVEIHKKIGTPEELAEADADALKTVQEVQQRIQQPWRQYMGQASQVANLKKKGTHGDDHSGKHDYGHKKEHAHQ